MFLVLSHYFAFLVDFFDTSIAIDFQFDWNGNFILIPTNQLCNIITNYPSDSHCGNFFSQHLWKTCHTITTHVMVSLSSSSYWVIYGQQWYYLLTMQIWLLNHNYLCNIIQFYCANFSSFIFSSILFFLWVLMTNSISISTTVAFSFFIFILIFIFIFVFISDTISSFYTIKSKKYCEYTKLHQNIKQSIVSISYCLLHPCVFVQKFKKSLLSHASSSWHMSWDLWMKHHDHKIIKLITKNMVSKPFLIWTCRFILFKKDLEGFGTLFDVWLNLRAKTAESTATMTLLNSLLIIPI